MGKGTEIRNPFKDPELAAMFDFFKYSIPPKKLVALMVSGYSFDELEAYANKIVRK